MPDKTNYQSFKQRIVAANTEADLINLSRSLDRLWNAGIFTVAQFSGLDGHIINRYDELNILPTKTKN